MSCCKLWYQLITNTYLVTLLSATRLLQRAATTPTQREELSALTQEAQALDRVLRLCLKDINLLQDDSNAKVCRWCRDSGVTKLITSRPGTAQSKSCSTYPVFKWEKKEYPKKRARCI